MYYYGKGVSQDRVEANRLFYEAADQGYERARRALALNGRRMGTLNKIILSMKFFAGVYFLIVALKPGQSLPNRQQRTTLLTGLLCLIYGGLDLCWYFYFGLLNLSPVVIAFYFVRWLLGGTVMAMLLRILAPSSAKVVLWISGISFVAFSLFAFARYELRHVPPSMRDLYFQSGFFIGMSIPSTITLWLDGRRNRGSPAIGTV
jgi:drug/metabolite transporter (DMT)-like permease